MFDATVVLDVITVLVFNMTLFESMYGYVVFVIPEIRPSVPTVIVGAL